MSIAAGQREAPPASVVAIINHKRGVGKTTTAVNLGVALPQMGKRVLPVGHDPQASLTIRLGIKQPEMVPANCGHVLFAAASGRHSPTLVETLVRSPGGLDLIPSGSYLADAECLLGQAGSAHGRTSFLRASLSLARRLRRWTARVAG